MSDCTLCFISQEWTHYYSTFYERANMSSNFTSSSLWFHEIRVNCSDDNSSILSKLLSWRSKSHTKGEQHNKPKPSFLSFRSCQYTRTGNSLFGLLLSTLRPCLCLFPSIILLFFLETFHFESLKVKNAF